MDFLKIISKAMILCTLILMPVMVKAGPPQPITDIEVVEEKVRSLRNAGVPAEDIAVILDFHGVVTPERKQEEKMTLNPAAVKFIKYLLVEKIQFVVGTAWIKFHQIEAEVEKLGLSDLLDLDSKQNAKEVFYLLGKDSTSNIQGYVNGRVTALKYTESKGWYRQKAFSLEAKFGPQKYKHVLFVDDDLGNHGQFEIDFMKTAVAESKPELLQFHLMPAPKATVKYIPKTYVPNISDAEDSDSFDLLQSARSIHSSGEEDLRGLRRDQSDGESLKSVSLANSTDSLKDSR